MAEGSTPRLMEASFVRADGSGRAAPVGAAGRPEAGLTAVGRGSVRLSKALWASVSCTTWVFCCWMGPEPLLGLRPAGGATIWVLSPDTGASLAVEGWLRSGARSRLRKISARGITDVSPSANLWRML